MTRIIQFVTKVNHGTIAIPLEYTDRISDDQEIEVIIKPRKTRLLDRLAKNPLNAPGWRELTRDRIHEDSVENQLQIVNPFVESENGSRGIKNE